LEKIFYKDSVLARKIKEKHGFIRITGTSKKVLMYFFIISLIYLGVSITFLSDFSSAKLTTHPSTHSNQENLNSSAYSRGACEEIAEVMRQAQNKVALLIVFAGLASLGVVYYLIMKILTPLDTIISSLQKISRGNLRETVSVAGIDEIRHLRDIINDITSNFQETLLLTASLSVSSQESLEKLKTEIHNASNEGNTAKEEITKLNDNMTELQEIIHYFQFYNVTIKDGHIHNIEHSNGDSILNENNDT
jgi:methyl-accepting chemotaxis protein